MRVKRLLISGGNGFIGKNLTEALSGDFEVFAPSSSELDIADGEQLERYLKDHRIDQIAHTATFKGRQTAPERELSVNLNMTFNLRRLANRVERILLLGSGAEYDKRFPIELATERDIEKRVPESAYGFSKYIANSVAENSENIYALRLFGVYGKYEPWQVCFISNLCCKAIYGLPLTIRQDCDFDFMYIDDLVMAVRWFLTGQPKYHCYNVCTGVPVRLSKIAGEVLSASGKELPVQIFKEGLNLPYTGDNSRLRAEYKTPFTPLSDAVKRLLEWYGEHPELIDLELLRRSK